MVCDEKRWFLEKSISLKLGINRLLVIIVAESSFLNEITQITRQVHPTCDKGRKGLDGKRCFLEKCIYLKLSGCY